MANVDLSVLRDATTKAILSWGGVYDPGANQEVVSVSIPEEDVTIFSSKYKFTLLGALIINAKQYYFLEITEDAVQHNPATGIPRLNKGGSDRFLLTLKKKDIQGNYHTDPSDDDLFYVGYAGGDAVAGGVDGVERGFKSDDVKSQIVKLSDPPTLVTGVVIDAISSNTPTGAGGQLIFTVAGTTLAWQPPTEVVPGVAVNVGAGGAFTLTANGGSTIDVTVTPASLPGVNRTDVLAVWINDIYETTKAINTSQMAVIIDGTVLDVAEYDVIESKKVRVYTLPDMDSSMSILYTIDVQGQTAQGNLEDGEAQGYIYSGTSVGVTIITLDSETVASARQDVETI